jgi:hypothetical protein
MPKELHEISQFQTGTITTPSERDIPDDAASYSVNIDPVSEDGVLKGCPKNDDVTYITNAELGLTDSLNVDATVMGKINDDGTYDMVFFDDNDNRLKKVSNVGSGTADATDLSSSFETHSGVPTMETNNKEIHIGMGNATTSEPKWAGHIGHGQFGGSAPSGVQLEDAELVKPASFVDMHKVINDGTYIYGVEYSGQTLFRFKISDRTLDKTGKPITKNIADLTAIGLASDGHIWILDSNTFNQGSNIIGVMYKIDKTTFAIKQENKLTLSSATPANKFSDIIEIGNYLWLSAPKNAADTAGKAYLVNVATPTTSGDNQTTHRMPYLRTDTAGSPSEGHFDTASSDNNAYMHHNIPKVSLMELKGSTTQCGMALSISDRDGSVSVATFVKASGTQTLRSAIIAVDEDSTSSSVLKDSGGVSNALFAISSNKELFAYDDDGTLDEFRGYATSDKDNWIAVSHFDSDADRSMVYKFAMPNMASYTNGDSITYNSYLDESINIKNAAITIVQNSSNQDYHLFASGDSVGRWSKLESINSSFHGNDATVVLQSDLNLSLALSTASGGSSANTGFTANYNYFYKASYVYDGYQESPLSSDFMISQGATETEISVDIEVFNVSALSKRVSHINVYMAEGGQGSSDPSGFYRLAKSISLGDAGWLEEADDAEVPDWGAKKVYRFLHSGSVTTSYEARTGISEILDNTILHYGLSTQLNNFHFVAECYHPTLSATNNDIDNFVYKSRPYNFDQFNYLEDFLILPTTPVALKGFMGRVYAFDHNNVYKIEPNSMYVEDIFEGMGCISKSAVFANDYGMCFVDNSNIYLYNGSNVQTIGDPILRGHSTSWQNRAQGFDPFVTFDSKTQSFLIFFKTKEGSETYESKYCCWSYNVLRKRWDLLSFLDTLSSSTVKPNSAIVWENGEVYISEDSSKDLTHFRGHASQTRNWDWYSKKLHMRQNTGDKKFKNIRVEGTSLGTLGTNCFVKVDENNITETESSSGSGVSDFFVGSTQAGTRGRHIQIYFSDNSGTVDAVGTVFRRYILLSNQE